MRKILLLITIIGLSIIMLASYSDVPMAQASTSTIFAGELDGGENYAVLNGCRRANGTAPYDVLGPYTVTESGDYDYRDISVDYDVNMQFFISTPIFLPSEPQANMLVLQGYTDAFNDFGTVELTTGTPYYLVVQGLCGRLTTIGNWEFSLDGPGSFELITNEPLASDQLAPQAGMISISQGQPVYDSAAGNIVRDSGGNELWLPQDFDHNGFDTHLVMSSMTVDGHVWYEIWIGNGGSTVWIPASNVTVVE